LGKFKEPEVFMKHPEKNHGFLGGSFIFSGKTAESKSSQYWLVKKSLKEPAVFMETPV
jgi:hypothetical protein